MRPEAPAGPQALPPHAPAGRPGPGLGEGWPRRFPPAPPTRHPLECCRTGPWWRPVCTGPPLPNSRCYRPAASLSPEPTPPRLSRWSAAGPELPLPPPLPWARLPGCRPQSSSPGKGVWPQPQGQSAWLPAQGLALGAHSSRPMCPWPTVLWAATLTLLPGQLRHHGLSPPGSGPFQGRGGSAQLRAARQGSMPPNPSGPLVPRDHGGPGRDDTEAALGPWASPPEYAVDWAPQVPGTTTGWGVPRLGTALPLPPATLRLSGPHRPPSTDHEAPLHAVVRGRRRAGLHGCDTDLGGQRGGGCWRVRGSSNGLESGLGAASGHT